MEIYGVKSHAEYDRDGQREELVAAGENTTPISICI